MASYKLAAATDGGVVVWSPAVGASSMTTIQASSKSAPVNAVRWNHNNAVVVSVGDEGVIALNHPSGGSVGCVPPIGTGPKRLLAFDLSSGSRYITTGGDAGLVTVWDLKTKKVVQSFTGDGSAVTAVAFANGGSHVAAGSEAGAVALHSIKTGISVARLAVPRASAVSSMAFSPFHPSKLAAGTVDGSVHMWDIHARSLTGTFSTHKAPVSAVAFSPVNHLLMASAGLDKRLYLYNVEKSSVMKFLTAEAPLSALAFADDSNVVAAGSPSGRVFLWDLRTNAGPSQTFSLPGGGPIRSLAFQSTVTKGKRTGVGSSASISARRSQASTLATRPPPPAADPLPADKRLAALSAAPSLFSPLKPSPALDMTATPGKSLTLAGQPDLSTNWSTASWGGLNAPAPDTAPGPAATSSLVKQLGSGPGQSRPSGIFSPLTGTAPSASSFIVTPGGPARPGPLLDETPLSGSKPRLSVETGSPAATPIRAADEASSGLTFSPPDAVGTLGSSKQATNEAAPPEGSSSLTAMQSQLLQSLLDERLGSFRGAIHSDVQNLHLELIRQFHLQSQQLSSMFAAQNKALLAELNALRAENAALRAAQSKPF